MPAHRVLVVDDNHEIRRMVTASIKTLGADIDVLDVPSAEEALVITASLPIDLVVLDFRLPGMTGLEMVTRLRSRKPAIKIVLVTGVEDADIRKEVAGAGVAAYFFKPLEIGTFLDAVKRAVGIDNGEVQVVGAETKTSEESSPNKGPSAATSINKPGSTSTAPARKTGIPTSKEPGVTISKPASPKGFRLTLDERLTALKQQVRATSVLLVDEVGQVKEVAGNPTQITSGIVLLPALMGAFRSSLRVSEALERGGTESLLCFMHGGRRIYLAPVDESYLLLLDTSGYFEPDRLGMLDRAIHSAVLDVRTILERMEDEKASLSAAQVNTQAELTGEGIVDEETLKGVSKIFSHKASDNSKKDADDFWHALEEQGAMDGAPSDGAISYDQALSMGLAPKNREQ